jgi:hypothetical protein
MRRAIWLAAKVPRVDGHHRVPVIERNVEHRHRAGQHGIVDQHLHTAPALVDLAGHSLRGAIGDVQPQVDGRFQSSASATDAALPASMSVTATRYPAPCRAARWPRAAAAAAR